MVIDGDFTTIRLILVVHFGEQSTLVQPGQNTIFMISVLKHMEYEDEIKIEEVKKI